MMVGIAAATTTLHGALVRQQLRAEAHAREGWLCTWFAAAMTLAMLALAGPVLFAAPRVLPWVEGGFGIEAAYHAAVALYLRRAPYRRAVGWANALVEVSLPFFLFIGDVRTVGGGPALASPTLLAWSGLITLSIMRFDVPLPLVAGALAAIESLAGYWFLARPDLVGTSVVTFTEPTMIARSLILLLTGGLCAAMAWFLAQRTEDVVRTLRSRDLFGKYVLHDRIGAGGMAEVFRATYCPEGGFEKLVAVKRILPAHAANSDFMRAFRREAELGSMLVHPNVVQVLDFGRFERSWFLAMELVDGMSLQSLLKRVAQPIPFPAVTFLGAELAMALDYVHSRSDAQGRPMGLVHRDLNPPNILLTRQGDPKLADFGIVRAEGGGGTKTGHVKGKLAWMAPEQLLGREYDGRADLYALGMTMLVTAAGANPLHGLSDSDVVAAKLNQDLPPLRSLRPDAPPALDELIRDLVARDPEARPASGRKVRDRILALGGVLAPYPQGQEVLSVLVTGILETIERPPDSDSSVTTRSLTERDLQRAREGGRR